MNTRLLLIGAALVGSTGLMAQNPQVSLGLDVALPMGDFGDFYSLGIGPTAGFELPLSDNLGVTAQLSYDLLTVKSDFSELVKSAAMLPIQAGLKYYFAGEQMGFYGHAQLGVHMSTVTTEDQSTTIFGVTTTTEGSTESSTNFSWALGVGYQMEKLDIGVRYNSISPDSDVEGAEASNYIGLRIAYLINLGG